MSAVFGRRSFLMLAGFCGWAVLLDAPARLDLTVEQEVRVRNLPGAMGHVFARTASDLWPSRESFPDRNTRALWGAHSAHLDAGGRPRRNAR